MRAGRPLHLRPQAFSVLAYLASNHGRLVTKGELATEVWNGRAVTDDSLVQCIGDIRRALGDESGDRLRTVRGRGYILDLDDEEDIPAALTPTADESGSSTPKLRQYRALAAAGLIATTTGLLGMLAFIANSCAQPSRESPTFVKLTSSIANGATGACPCSIRGPGGNGTFRMLPISNVTTA